MYFEPPDAAVVVQGSELLKSLPQPPHPLQNLPHIRRSKTKPQRRHIRISRLKRLAKHKRHALLYRAPGEFTGVVELASDACVARGFSHQSYAEKIEHKSLVRAATEPPCVAPQAWSAA